MLRTIEQLLRQMILTAEDDPLVRRWAQRLLEGDRAAAERPEAHPADEKWMEEVA